MRSKKLFVLMVLAMFVISMIPLAAAQESNDTGNQASGEDVQASDDNGLTNEEFIAETEAEDGAVMAMESGELPADPQLCWEKMQEEHPKVSEDRAKLLCRAKRIRRLIKVRLGTEGETTRLRTQETYQKELGPKAQEYLKRKEMAQERIQNARERYLKAKEKYQNARERYKEARKDINQIKANLKRCRSEGKDAEVCKEAKEKGKEFLFDAADVGIEHLNKLISKVEETDAEDKDDVLAELNERLGALEEAKKTVENLAADASEEDVRKAAKTIREEWTKAKRTLKRRIGWLVGAKLEVMLKQFEALDKRMEGAVAKLEDKGYDVSGLEEKLADYNSEVEAAKEAHETAAEKFKEARTSDDVDTLVKDAHDYLKKSRTHLNEAKKLLRDMVKGIKEMNRSALQEDGSVDASDKTASTYNETGTEETNTSEE